MLRIIHLLVFVCLSGSLLKAETLLSDLARGQKAPAFAFQDLTGQQLTLSQNYGQRVSVLAFVRLGGWPCRKLMTELKKLRAQYPPGRVAIYAVAVEGQKALAAAQTTAQQLGLTYPLVLPKEEGWPVSYRRVPAPYVLVIDAQGIIRELQRGYTEETIGALAAAIEQSLPPPLPRIVDIEGPGCPTCRLMPVVLREIAAQFAGKIDVETIVLTPEIGEQYQIEIVPTLLFFDAQGKEVYRRAGPMSKEEIITQLRQLGMLEENETPDGG